MPIHRSPGVWESITDQVRIRRSIESLEGNEYLVRLTFDNTAEHDVVVRILEDLPPSVSEATLVTAPGGDPAAWRQFGEWIVHDARIPERAERTVAYVLESEDGSTIRLPPPRVRSVEPPDSATGTPVSDGDGRSLPTADSDRTSNDEVAPDAAPQHEAHVAPRTAQSGSLEGDAILDQLVEALEDEELIDRRRELRSKLGLTPSERARFEHVQSRLDDLAAYVDALETLVDDHGIDVIDEVRDAVERNEARTESLAEAFEAMEDDVERYRADADRELALIRDDLTALDDEVGDRFSDLERKLDRLEREVATVRDQRRADRQALARDVRRLEQSLSSLSATVSDLESEVGEVAEFRDRFTAVFQSESSSTTGDR